MVLAGFLIPLPRNCSQVCAFLEPPHFLPVLAEPEPVPAAPCCASSRPSRGSVPGQEGGAGVSLAEAGGAGLMRGEGRCVPLSVDAFGGAARGTAIVPSGCHAPSFPPDSFISRPAQRWEVQVSLKERISYLSIIMTTALSAHHADGKSMN